MLSNLYRSVDMQVKILTRGNDNLLSLQVEFLERLTHLNLVSVSGGEAKGLTVSSS